MILGLWTVRPVFEAPFLLFLLFLPVPTNLLFLRILQLGCFYFQFYIYLRIMYGEKK